jgi:hypothetical protein
MLTRHLNNADWLKGPAKAAAYSGEDLRANREYHVGVVAGAVAVVPVASGSH